MKAFKYIAAMLLGIVLFNACEVDEKLNQDPNKPASPDTRFLFLRAQKYAPLFAWNNNYDPWVQLYPQYIAELKNIQFTRFSITDYSMRDHYSVALHNLQTVIALNQNEETKKDGGVTALGSTNNQIAAATTLKAFIYMHLTDIVGALPYTEALKGEANFTPKFDTQETVYKGLFAELNQAYGQFETNGALDEQYDILYNGNIARWKKLNASIRMMMAIKLQKAAPELGKAEFAKAYADGSIIDNADNLVYKHLLENANENPLFYNMVRGGRKDFSPSATLVDTLKAYNDPRLQEYTAPNNAGEYVGATFGWTAAQAAQSSLDKVCAFHAKYYKKDAPITLVSASQVLLMQTEAALIGWIDADAETLYKEGISKAFAQHNIAEKVDAYLQEPKVAFTGTDADKLYKLAMQKWIANYMQDGVEAWSDWRRLRVPTLEPGEEGSVNVKHIPYRKRYASVDFVSNRANYDAAIAAQGADNVETLLWWNK